MDGVLPGELKIAVGDLGKTFATLVSAGTYEDQVDELIVKAFTQGWLIELRDILVRKRENHPPVRDPILAVRQWLQDMRDKHEDEWPASRMVRV
ncbi:MAG: hypothetical protein ABWY82_26960, partial [Tardiphaga sp.]